MSDVPRRVIVIDPSLRDNIGHHVEYDMALLRGAVGANLEVMVLAHKDASKLLPANSGIVPAFSEDMWGHQRSAADPDVRRSIFLHWLLASPSIPVLFAASALSLCARTRVAGRLRQALAKWGRNCASLGRKIISPVPIVLAQDLYLAVRDCCERLPGLRWLSHPLLCNPKFYFELRKGLRTVGFDSRDLVFCHMATHRQLLEWGLFATKLPSARFAQLVILMRYPPHFYAPATLQSKLAFRLLEQAFEAGNLRLATDSARLASDFADLTYIPFEVLPIPHTDAHAQSAVQTRPHGTKIRVASLGNARAEKGIVEILDAVRMLEETYDRHAELEFVLQLNDPDEACADRVRAFVDAPPSNVLLLREALSSEDYQRLLATVDVVLVPYWGEIYASRTSGVFLEALATGKPVVATENTWMADELERSGAGIAIPSHSAKAIATAITTIHRNFESFRTRARELAPAYVRRHSGEAMLRQLVLRVQPECHRRRALVVYPWIGLRNRASGAAIRTAGLVDTLGESGWEIAVLMPQTPLHLSGQLEPEHLRAVGSSAVEFVGEIPSPFHSPRLALFILTMRARTLGRSRVADRLLYMHRHWLRARHFKLTLNRALRDCGAVLVEYTFLADLIRPFAVAMRIPLIVTSHDVLALQVPDAAFRAEVLRVEAAALNVADLAVSVSSQDQAQFRQAGAETIVVPNSVRTGAIARPAPSEARRLLALHGIPPSRPFVLFFGSHYPPNNQARDILKNLAPALASRVPGALVVVAGSCARRADSMGNFHCLGEVSDEVKAALYEVCGAVVIPLLQGTGTSLKTVEALAHGRPVIGTSVAFRGLKVENGVHVVIQNDISALVKDITEVLRSPDRARRLGQAARSIAVDLDVDKVYRPYFEFLERGSASEEFGNQVAARIAE